MSEFFHQEVESAGRVCVQVGGALVTQENMMGFRALGEFLLRLVVVDDGADVEGALLEPLQHQTGEGDVDGPHHVRTLVLRLTPTVKEQDLVARSKFMA